jgi:glycosidase
VAGHGFTTGPPWLRFGDDAADRNVATQRSDPDSVLSTYRRLIALRRSHEALRTGTLRLAETGSGDVLAWHREAPGERLLIVANFADAPRATQVPKEGASYRAIGGSHADPTGPAVDGSISLRPLEAVVLLAD